MKIIKLYFFIATLIFVVNFIRFIICCRLKVIYNTNISKNIPDKNYHIKQFVYSIFLKGNTQICDDRLSLIAEKTYQADFNAAFEHSKSVFFRNFILAIVWPYLATEKLTMFSLGKRIENKIVRFIFALFQVFATYLLGLFLDTTGIGNKILNTLLDFLKNLTQIFH